MLVRVKFLIYPVNALDEGIVLVRSCQVKILSLNKPFSHAVPVLKGKVKQRSPHVHIVGHCKLREVLSQGIIHVSV